jgi:hypothetical protein
MPVICTMSPARPSSSHLVQALVAQHLADLGLHRGALVLGHLLVGAEQHHHLLAGLDPAALDAADADAAHVAVVVQGGNLQLQGRALVGGGRRHVLQHGLEQGLHVHARLIHFHGGPAVEAGGIDDGEVHLLVGSTQLVEQVEGQVHGVVGVGAVPVHLVHHHDGRSPRARAFLVTKRVWGMGPSTASTSSSTPSTMPSTRSTSPPKSAWPGVSTMLMCTPVVIDRGVLGQDGDAPLLFQVVGVHDPLGQLLVGGEGAGLAEQLVHQGGLAMIDVGDDGDIAEGAGHVGKVGRMQRANGGELRYLHAISS